jgi:DNA-binding HxlR family transcriptional regulator
MRKQTSTNRVNEEYLMTTCDFNYVLKLIGGRWKSQILFSMARGNNRFSLLKNDMENISDQVLGRQLRTLEEGGLIEKTEIPDTTPNGIKYSFTEKTSTLIPLLREVCYWGQNNKR